LRIIASYAESTVDPMRMFFSRLLVLLVSLALAVCAPNVCGQPVATIQRVYVADASGTEIRNDVGTVHLVDSHGTDIVPPKITDQKSCNLPRTSADKQTAGWQVNFENCCTSYDIPLTLVLYRAGKIVQTIAAGQMIYDWQFWANDKVAISSGPTHGDFGRHLGLYDVTTGKLLKEWRGEQGDTPPAWGKGLRQ